MNLDELARQAAADVRTAHRSIPVEPIETVRRRRRTAVFVPAVAGLAAVWIGVAVFAFPSQTEAPVATDVTTSTTSGETETTTAGIDAIAQESVTEGDLEALPMFTETITPLFDLDDPCCVAVGPSGEGLVLDRNSLTSTGADTRPIARWDDIEASSLVAGDAGVIIGGTGSTGSQLRALGLDGSTAWTLPLDTDLDGALLAIDAEGVIWAGLRDALPADAGFAGIQWLSVATVDGEPVSEQRRTELRPLPDGRRIGITEDSVTLADPDGSGIEWQLPPGVRVISADPFLDGVVVTATPASAASTGGSMLVLSLQPGRAPMALSVDRTWGSVDPGPANTAAGPTAVFGIGLGDEGPFVSTAPLARLIPLAPLNLDDAAWVTGSVDKMTDDRGTTLAWIPFSFAGRNTAWDGDRGLVAVQDGGGGVLWITPAGTTEVPLPMAELAIVDVAIVGDVHVIGVRPIGGPVSWYELETGVQVDPPSGPRTLDGETFIVGDRTARIEDPDWSTVALDEAGGPIAPFDLPELVVTDRGREVLRIPVGSERRPYVDIHDFDGRRLVLGAMPQEPASPPTTVWIIDLECADCTRVIETGSPQWFDLVGTIESEGDVVVPQLP